MVLTVIFTFLVNLILIQGRTDAETNLANRLNHTHLDIYANALGKAHYNAWRCTYRLEPGYKCLSCYAALHCYPSDFALLVQCAGLFPYCRNGYCSRFKTEDCNVDYYYAEGTHGPLRVTTEVNNKVTVPAEETPDSGTTEGVPDDNAVTSSVMSDLTKLN